MTEPISINDAQHPARQKAIQILETIAELLGDEDIFNCRGGNGRWFDFEDAVTNIIAGK